MKFLSTVFWIILLLIPVGLVFLAVNCLSDSALITSTAELTPRKVERAQSLIREHDIRRLKDNDIKTFMISADELALVMSHSIQRFANGGAVVRINDGLLDTQATIEISGLGKRSFLNLSFEFRETAGMPQLNYFKAGKINFPPKLVTSISRFVLLHIYRDAEFEDGDDIFRAVNFSPNKLAITYQWKAALADAVRNRVLSGDDVHRLHAYNDHLADLFTSRTRQIDLETLLETLFGLAQKRSKTEDPVAENRMAIITLANYVNGRRMGSLIPEVSSWRMPNRVKVVSHRRHDLVQHFATSAALAVTGGGSIADAIGLYKEIDDSDGGSGFSFKDLAADRAGTRFGEVAVESSASALALQQRVASGVSANEAIPDLTGLVENMNEAAFSRKYGKVGSDAYQTVVQTIDDRIAASRLYKK